MARCAPPVRTGTHAGRLAWLDASSLSRFGGAIAFRSPASALVLAVSRRPQRGAHDFALLRSGLRPALSLQLPDGAHFSGMRRARPLVLRSTPSPTQKTPWAGWRSLSAIPGTSHALLLGPRDAGGAVANAGADGTWALQIAVLVGKPAGILLGARRCSPLQASPAASR